MLDNLVGGIVGFVQGYGHKDHRSGGGYGFEEKKHFAAHVGTEGGYYDRQAGYEHRMRLPANHGRPPMARMAAFEEDSDAEFFETSRSHHAGFAHHSNNQHHGHMGTGWHGQPGGAYHGGHGIQHHGEHGMHHHDMHGMQHQGGHGMQHQAGFGMKYEKYTASQIPPRNGYMNPNHGQKVGWGSKGL